MTGPRAGTAVTGYCVAGGSVQLAISERFLMERAVATAGGFIIRSAVNIVYAVGSKGDLAAVTEEVVV
jgi:hypothetical protein